MRMFILEVLRFVGMVAFFVVPLVVLHLFNEADKDAVIYPDSGFCPECPVHEEGGRCEGA